MKRLDAPNAAEIPPIIHYFWRFCEKTWVQNEVKKLPGPNRQLDDKKSAGQLEVIREDPTRTRKSEFGRVLSLPGNLTSSGRTQPERGNSYLVGSTAFKLTRNQSEGPNQNKKIK